MKKIFSILLAALFSFSSCSFFEEDEAVKPRPEEGKAYVTFSVNKDSIRSISHGKNVNDLTDFKFAYKANDSDDYGEMTPVADNLVALNTASVEVPLGNWIFKLSAKLGETEFSGEIKKEIKAGENQNLSFTLAPPEGTKGGVSITVTFSGDARPSSVRVTFSKAGETSTAESLGLTGDTVVFAKDELAPGQYSIFFEFLGTKGAVLSSYGTEIVNVAAGITTEYAMSININDEYTITYERNGGTCSEPMVSTYSARSDTITLPVPVKTGYVFAGWYEDSEFSGTPVTEITKVSSGNKTFYACFIDTIYVKDGGASYIGGASNPNNVPVDGTRATAPLDSIYSALFKIIEYNAPDVDWNIVIDGTVTGNQCVSNDLSAKYAKSLTIQGAHQVAAGEDPQDTLDGGFSAEGGGKTLSVQTDLYEGKKLPVTLKNLKIIGGYLPEYDMGAGLCVDTNSDVKTSGVVLITGNTAGVGAGVYVSGKFTVNEGCSITNNNALVQGGGVCVYSTGTLELCGGTISENTVDSTTGKGAGVYVSNAGGKGTLRMSGTGSVAVNNDVYLETGTTITIAGALSGGDGTGCVATITPAVYEDNLEVLALADTLTQNTSIDEEYGKFDVVPNEHIEWCLNNEGKIKVKTDVYVASSSSTHSGNDTTGDGSAFKPYATLQTAVTKIKALAVHNPTDYVIHVNGDTDCSTLLSVDTVKTVNGEAQLVEGTLGEFTGSTLKICGTNKEQDKLKGWRTGSDGKDLLAITCPNQVTVENLTLYGLITNNCHAALFADLLADVTVKNCIITGNNQTYGTDSAGGGIYNKGKMTVSDCTITGNNSIAGAGVSNAGWMKLERCIISENGNIGNGASSGAGIYNASITSNSYAGELNIINCQIINNILGKKSLNNTTTGKSGAGIYINGGTVTIEDSEITGNTNIKPTANANALYGGGIYLRPDVNSVRLNLKGKVIIQNNTNYDGIENNVYIDRKKSTIKLVNITGSLDQDSRIGITISDEPALTSSFVFTNGINYSNLTTDQLSQVFTSDNKDYDVIFETGAEGILARKNYSVGDLLLNDCSLVPYSETSSFTAEQIGKAVGIVYALDENGAPRGILGLKNSGETTYSWAPNGTTGNSTDFTDIGVTQVYAEPADGTPYCQFEYAGSSYYLTGDLDGSDNWEYIKTQDSAGTSNAVANYPAFNWVNNYASTAGLTGDYAEGWYMPSIAELWYIYKNREKLDAVLSAINTVSAGAATTLGNEWDYLSSSQLASNEYVIWKLKFSNGDVSQDNYKGSEQHVCVVRSANATPEYAVIFSTNGGSLIASQKVQKNQTATAPESVPTKSGYIFGGWYTSSDGGTTLSSEPFDFNTEITGHTVLYAKWSDFVLVEGATINGAVSSSSVFVSGKTITIENLYVCNHEVTQGEFTKIMGVNPSNFNSNPAEGEIQENRPVDQVNWYMTIAYCNKRSLAENLTPCYSVEGISDWESLNFSDIPTTDNSNWNKASCDFTADGYRLPTHAEWEYAARGGNGLTGAQMIFSGHNTSLPDVGWYIDNASSMTHEVRKKSPNALGLYDMSGNLYEWVWDAYNADGSSHYDCGGSWLSSYSDCYVYSFSYPDSSWSNYGDGSYFGFRVVRTAN